MYRASSVVYSGAFTIGTVENSRLPGCCMAEITMWEKNKNTLAPFSGTEV